MKQKINCNWHRYVDLGLPSGLLWATCNIGASEPWERGLYFSWGNVEGHAKGSGYDFCETEYPTTPGAALTGDIPVNAKYDAARANIGGSWRIPTKNEFQELRGNCASKWVAQEGVNGRLFTSLINDNSVFFPAADGYYGTSLDYDGEYGYYWSSSFRWQIAASDLIFNNCYVSPQSNNSRFFGFPVRPVLDHPKDSLLIKTIKR